MIINEKEIQARIVEVLKSNGFSVIASEIEEGFSKPAVFVNVYPATIHLLNADTEQVIDTIEIKYIPAVETVEECARVAQVLRRIFMYTPFVIKDRRLTIEQLEFDIEKYVLYTYFELEYIQETPFDEEYDEMKELEIGWSEA